MPKHFFINFINKSAAVPRQQAEAQTRTITSQPRRHKLEWQRGEGLRDPQEAERDGVEVGGGANLFGCSQHKPQPGSFGLAKPGAQICPAKK